MKLGRPKLSPPRLSPKEGLRWLLVLLLGVMALGVAAIFFVVAAGKLGVELLPTFEMRLFIATTAAWSLVLWAITAGGFGAAAVLLARRSKAAMFAWMAGFAGAVITQAMETTTANAVGADTDPSGGITLFLMALMGWGVFTLTWRKPPSLPRR